MMPNGRKIREQAAAWIGKTFGAEAEYLWEQTPEYAVFRHLGNRKWFAVIMTVPARVLGQEEDGNAEILNLKLKPALIGLLTDGRGYLPAYHMNKRHWITVRMDRVPPEEWYPLVGMSYRLTDRKKNAGREKE